MPLTDFQREILKLLASNRSDDSHLAGGAALHMYPNSKRYSNDLDFFHDSEQRVGTAFSKDAKRLKKSGYRIEIEMNQPGYIRAVVSRGSDGTKIEWAHDSAWRFLPPIHSAEVGCHLDPVDLAVNKVLALAGRDEPRDFLDIMYIHERILPLGALLWAAAGKDPGFTPRSLLELIRRRGKYRQEDFARLNLAEPVDLHELKTRWLAALDDAAKFIAERPPKEAGCLYFSRKRGKFVAPDNDRPDPSDEIVPHFGRPGGVLPRCEG